MGRQLSVLWACVWACVLACAGAVRVENGVYEDLVVALDPTIEMDTLDLMTLQQNFQAMMKDMSDAMMTATNDRLSVGSVRVIIPHWWQNTEVLTLFPAAEDFSWHAADIRMEVPPEKVFGGYERHAPHTLQMGQCGVPGRHITVHTTLLENGYSEDNYGYRGHVLMHEWAHYRWGVFDEYGHPKDPKYPVSYEDEVGAREVTACYEGELIGDFLTLAKGECPGDPNDSKNPCYFFPNASITAAETLSSLMAHTSLSDGRFCTNETHDSSAPTPQNFMCGGRSVWAVLEAHPDFLELGGATTNSPTVTFHKAPMKRVFILFDEPPEDVIYLVREEVEMFVNEFTGLYGSVELGLATFSSAADGTVNIYNELAFTPVSNYSSIEDYVPNYGMTTVGNNNSSDTHLGQALLELLPEWEPFEPGTLVVALTYNTLSDNNTKEELITEILDDGVKLLVVNPLGDLLDILPIIPVLQNTGGNFYVEDWHNSSSLIRLHEDVSKYLQNHTFDDHKLYSVSNLEVEPNSAGQQSFNENRGLVKQVNGYLRITSSSDPQLIDITLKIPYMSKSLSCGDFDAEVKLHCEYAPDGLFFYFYTPTSYWTRLDYLLMINNKGSEKVAVESTLSMVEDDALNPRIFVEVWTSEDRGVKANIVEANSLYLYCQVAHTLGVVQYVEVTAEVEFDQGGTTSTQVITLSDAGDGVVDVRAKDTVWSGRLAGEWSPGTTLTVTTLTISNKEDVRSAVQRETSSRSGSSSSGSSVLPIDPRDADCLSYSTATTVSKSYDLNQILRRPYSVTFASDVTNVPPSVDVTLEPADPPYITNDTVIVTILLSGTETAARTARSSVEYTYRARYHPDAAILQNDFDSAETPLDGADAPSTATSMTVTLPYDESQDVFVAVALVDPISGVTGTPSTPIPVAMTQLTTTTTSTTTTTTTTPTTTTTTTPTTTTTTTTTTPPSTVSPSPTPTPTTTTTTTTTAPAAEDDNSTVIIVVSVVCAVVAVGVAGGLFYYFKYYKTRTV